MKVSIARMVPVIGFRPATKKPPSHTPTNSDVTTSLNTRARTIASNGGRRLIQPGRTRVSNVAIGVSHPPMTASGKSSGALDRDTLELEPAALAHLHVPSGEDPTRLGADANVPRWPDWTWRRPRGRIPPRGRPRSGLPPGPSRCRAGSLAGSPGPPAWRHRSEPGRPDPLRCVSRTCGLLCGMRPGRRPGASPSGREAREATRRL